MLRSPKLRFSPFLLETRSLPPDLFPFQLSAFETRLLPTCARSYPRHFTFYVAHPTRSIQSFSFYSSFFLLNSFPRSSSPLRAPCSLLAPAFYFLLSTFPSFLPARRSQLPACFLVSTFYFLLSTFLLLFSCAKADCR